MGNERYTGFLKSEDQQARRAELLAFIGPNPSAFMKAYEGQVEMANRAPGTKPKFRFGQGLIWPAFFLGPIWFFYRKMWAWGAGISAFIIVLGVLPLHSNALGFGLGVGLTAVSGMAYVNHAIRKIEAMRVARGGGALDLQEVAAVGGVSKTAGWIGGIVYVLLVALVLIGAVFMSQHPGANHGAF